MNRKYTAPELAFVKRRKKMPRRDLHAAFIRRFPSRRDVTLKKLKYLCDDRGWGVGSLKGRKRGSRRYSKAELSFVKRRRKMPRRVLHAAFVEKFQRSDVSFSMFVALCKNRGWTSGHAGSRAKKGQTKFSRAELAFIKRRRATPRPQLHVEFVERFGRQMTFGAFRTFCKRFRVLTGRTGGFAKGHVPWTAGKKLPFSANSAATQFKKGQLPHNAKPVGHETVRTDGYVDIKVNETNPYTGAERRFVRKHRLLWEQAHGPVPEGMVLKCKGNKRNSDPSNWELVPIGVLPRLNGKSGRGYDEAPDDLKPTIMAVAKLEHQLRETKRGEGKAR